MYSLLVLIEAKLNILTLKCLASEFLELHTTLRTAITSGLSSLGKSSYRSLVSSFVLTVSASDPLSSPHSGSGPIVAGFTSDTATANEWI